jgi:hypothetical protein
MINIFDHARGFSVGQVNQTDLDLLKALSDEIKMICPKLPKKSLAHIWEMSTDQNIQNLSQSSRDVVLTIAKMFNTTVHLLFQKVWVVESSADDADVTGLPFLPHFDLRRTTKIMFYLTDVELKHGPMFIAKNVIPASFEANRKAAIARGDNLITDKYFEFEALTGKAGHFHIFDTNIPHYAGEPFDGGVRKIIRFDFIHGDL